MLSPVTSIASDPTMLDRFYTKPGVDPLDEVTWEKRTTKIAEPDGSVVFLAENMEVPAHFSQLASDIAVSKYYRKAGLHGDKKKGETSFRQVVTRIARSIRVAGEDYGYFKPGEADVFEAELTHMLVNQIGAFNSPVWFNCGLWQEYKITNSGGTWAYNLDGYATGSPAGDDVVQLENSYERPQCSACMPYDVRVNTDNGLTPIGEIVERFKTNPHETLITFDRDGNPTKIVRAICNGKRFVMEFELKDGSTLRMTSDHIVFAKGREGSIVEKQAGDLVLGEDSLILSRKPLLGQLRPQVGGFLWLTEELAWISGVMVGNGFSGRPPSSTSDTWELKVNTLAEVTRIETLLNHHGVPFTTTPFSWGAAVRGYGSAGRAFWERLGLWDKTGAKEVPAWMFRAGAPIAGAFLRGLFDTDGTVAQLSNNRVRVSLANTSEQVIDTAQVLLRSMGVFASKTVYEDPRDDASRKEGFTLSIDDVGSVDRFAEMVGFTHETKKAELAARAPDRDRAYRDDSVLVVGKRKVGSTLVYDIQTEAGVFWAEGVLVHNCFIQRIDDDLMSLFQSMQNEARLFKYGSGTGSNFSRIRSRYEKLSGGGFSSGLMGFLEVFDRAAGAIKSGGTTRRAAKMVSLDMDHPEIVDFIDWKMREEHKARVLIDHGGFNADFNDEAYHTVSGQNSNNSVRVTDEFMRAVDEDGSWETKARTTGETVHTHKARDLWNKIAEAAWRCADPGVQYDTTINKWHTVPTSGRINGSNPCSEFMHLDDTSCNLASLNLVKFLKPGGSFDLDAYHHAIRVFIVAQEILVDFSSYPTAQIARNSHDFRPLGLGYANLGTLLMVQGVPYDSDTGRHIAACLTAILTGHAYRVSAEIAERKGPFPGYERNKEPMLQVMNMHKQAAADIVEPEDMDPAGQGSRNTRHLYELQECAVNDWREAVVFGEKHGYRNAQMTVLAPTGTIGLLMDCDTTGIEPDFSLVKYKKLAGGGQVKIVNQSVTRALKRLGFGPADIAAALEYIREHDTIEGWPKLADSMLPVFDCANRGGKIGKRCLAPMAHIRMMAAAQPFLSGAISKTVNMPNEATVDDVRDIYYQGWKLGLKAVALYRNGCKASQPLNTSKDDPATAPASLARGTRVRLTKRRTGFTQEARVGGHKVFLRTGDYPDGTLGEVFIDMAKAGAGYRSIMHCFAMAVSLGLQYGVPLEAYVRQLTHVRFEPAGPVEGDQHVKMATSMIDYVFRVLGIEYLKRDDLAHIKPGKLKLADPGEQAAEDVPSAQHATVPPRAEEPGSLHASSDAPFCPECGNLTQRSGSCYVCLSCGSTTGCS